MKKTFNFIINSNDRNIIEVPYYEFNEVINNELFRKVFVIDLINMNREKVINLLNNFNFFQEQFGHNLYYDLNNRFRKNNTLLFLYNDDLREIINIIRNQMVNNYDYFLKDFITEGVFKNITNIDAILQENNMVVSDKIINTSGFNLLYGPNNSGKTILLNKISDTLDTRIFNCFNIKRENLEESELFKFYYKLLTNKDIVEIYSTIDIIYYNLCFGLTYAKLNNKILLLDDIGWLSIDKRNIINIIDNLNEFLYTNGIVVTACNETVKTLVKNRVYNPNIVEF